MAAMAMEGGLVQFVCGRVIFSCLADSLKEGPQQRYSSPATDLNLYSQSQVSPVCRLTLVSKAELELGLG